ncbi:MAG TPA: tetratricopeptide repeat protein [Chitinophaga sp.]|uniref:tetratricopeptide repeat protein n=1 Tax=Chitinophaga sp. TaxID=1869181 RepID=UPI002DBE25F1|nr:tetratricopeptide repeat protein [Chitinophaga sp.]HEU4552508.1 tetratricopeptide repeat protein [Chitinophaga sp.]
MASAIKYLLPVVLLCSCLQAAAQIFGNKGKDAEALYNEAVQQTKQQHYQRAIELSKQALARQPDMVDQQLLLGRLYMLTGQNNLARRYIKQVIGASPRYRDAYFYAINIELADKKYEEAECYADQALGYFPNDRELMLKKLGVLDAAQQFYKGDAFATTLLNTYPEDTTARNAYTGHYLLSGHYYQAQGNNNQARASYEKALMIAPGNEEARTAITNMYIRSGNYGPALEQVNAELTVNPSSYGLLMRKLSLLQDMHNYAEAIAVLQQVLKYYPNDSKARAMDISLRMEAAAYYTQTDPYLLYQGILEKDPGNQEALDKVIGLSMSRGAYREALSWINRGLQQHPNDTRLLGLKVDMLESDRKFTEAAALAGRLWQASPGSAGLQQHYVTLKVASGRDYLAQQQYDLALSEFEMALQAAPADTTALDMMANTYLSQKQPAQALQVLEQALRTYPGNARFRLKQAGILASMGRYDEAADIAEQLLAKYPGNPKYKGILTEIRLTAGRMLMQTEEYEMARGQLQAVLAQQPDNMEALNYLINLESALQQPDSALYYVNTALQYHPDDKDLLLKKAGMLNGLKRYDEAGAITYGLMQRYPFSAKYRNAYTEGLLAAGLAFQRDNKPDSALHTFNQVLQLNPRDSLALLYSINILDSRQQYDSALLYASQGIRYYPGNAAFLQKRAVTLENKKDYTQAAQAADSLALLQHSDANIDYADYLRSKTLKNQFGMFFLHSSYDYSDNKYNIATLEYRHYFKRGTYALRLNYAGRRQGTGLMGEAELYYTHSKQLYSYALASYSNELVFPKVRLAYSLFTTFKHGIEAELGARYLQQADSGSVVSGVASLSKTWRDFYVNMRAYFISDQPDFYTSFNLTTRYYMNRGQDYISFIAGLGTSPDDRSRLIQFPKLAGLLTRSVGAGYQKTFRYRTTVGLYGTWINQKISDTDFQNQYDIYVTLQRRF